MVVRQLGRSLLSASIVNVSANVQYELVKVKHDGLDND